eukprot:scaffold36641_cov88-Skeletonema_marinoi.AAC.1
MSMPQDEPTANLGPFAILTSSYILCYCYCPPCLAFEDEDEEHLHLELTAERGPKEEQPGRRAALLLLTAPLALACYCYPYYLHVHRTYFILYLEKMKSWLKELIHTKLRLCRVQQNFELLLFDDDDHR